MSDVWGGGGGGALYNLCVVIDIHVFVLVLVPMCLVWALVLVQAFLFHQQASRHCLLLHSGKAWSMIM